jgi:hypothetical protein
MFTVHTSENLMFREVRFRTIRAMSWHLRPQQAEETMPVVYS